MDDTFHDVADGFMNAGNSFKEQTSSFFTWIKGFMTWENLFKLLGSCIILFIFWIIYRLIIRGIKKVPEKKLSKPRSLIILKFVKYIFYVIIVMYVLSLFGVKLAAIWLKPPETGNAGNTANAPAMPLNSFPVSFVFISRPWCLFAQTPVSPCRHQACSCRNRQPPS